jgi:RNA polymerase sigma-70 factor, ECF subfamily
MSAAPRLQPSPKSDAELIAAIVSGNLEALGVLFDRYEGDVRRYLGRLGINASDADDLVQVTFLAVVGAGQNFDPAHSARAWLLGVATMIVRRHRRSLARTLARLVTWSRMPRASSSPGPDEAYDSDEAMRRFQAAFEALSPKKREAFALVVLEGLSGEEAAAAIGIPINTVWTRLHHARRELRRALNEGDA